MAESNKVPYSRMSAGKRLALCFVTFGIPIFLLSILMDWKDYGPFTLIDAAFEAVGGSLFLFLIEWVFAKHTSRNRE